MKWFGSKLKLIQPIPASTVFPPKSAQTEIFEQINAFRQGYGACQLRQSTKLNQMSYEHAVTMFKDEQLSHKDFTGRVQQANLHGRRIGESVGYATHPDGMIVDWLSDDQHVGNIINPEFEWIGIGFFNNYYVTLFMNSDDTSKIRSVQQSTPLDP